MADSLIVAGIPTRVVRNSWREPPILYQGGRVRAYAGNAISTEDPSTAKRSATCTIYWLTRAEEAAFRAAVPIGTPVDISGDSPGSTWTVLVDIGEATRPWIDAGGTIHWRASFSVEEV